MGRPKENDIYDYSKTMPYYCKECGQCKNYKESYKNLKVHNVGYGCRDIFCLKKQCIAQYL